jgi:hypothetical protein
VEAASVPWRPLGELFVNRGLISEAELETALAEQAATGKRLGEILVERGLVSGPDLTSALMDQLGVEISKEEGFGSGLWAEIKRRHRRGAMQDDDAPSTATLRPVESEPQPDEPEYDAEPEPEPEPEPFAPPPAAEAAVEPEPDLQPEAAVEPEQEPEPELQEELQEELEEIIAAYEPPPPIEPVAEAETKLAEPEPPVQEHHAAADWAEPEPAPIVAVEPDPEPQPDPAAAADEPLAAVGESEDTAELRAELDLARTDLAQLQEMLADAMTALSALTTDAPVEPYAQ